MDMKLSIKPISGQVEKDVNAIEACNRETEKFGLVLSRAQIQKLVAHRFDMLKSTRRVEFDEGILEKLIRVFYDSPYIHADNYEETLLELQEMFYQLKNETFEQLSDDELLHAMKTGFDGPAQGSLEYLAGTWAETLTRRMRTGGWGYELTFDFEDEPDE